MAYHVIAERAPSGANVTEWAKREQCWRLMREQPWDVPPSLSSTSRRSFSRDL